MARAFPSDVLHLDSDSLLFARFQRGKRPGLVTARSYTLSSDTFTAGAVSPVLTNAESLKAAVERVKREHGHLQDVSLLLPDPWFRINLVEVPDLPAKKADGDEVIRWTLKKTLPIRPEDLRIAYQSVGTGENGVRVLVVAALDKTIASIEQALASAGLNVVLIEPAGLNLWNRVAAQADATPVNRLFFYLRERDFTTAAFRGSDPLFVRSRSIADDQSLQQAIRLSASYLRSNLGSMKIESCYVAGNRLRPEISQLITTEFEAPSRKVSLADYADVPASIDLSTFEAELTACSGVFAS